MENDILEFIKSCVENRRIFWTHHVNVRLKERYIPAEAILSTLDSYEIIEEYDENRYFPSYLIYTEYRYEVIHILIAVDRENCNVRIVTSYKPTIKKWEIDFKTRRVL
ncbi:MAG: DUF4258 domain-containing protein [Candidatus Magnetobacterium sp. LHC-1]